MLFVSNTQFNIGELEVFDDFSYDDYLEWKTQDSKRASLCPETCFELSPETSYRFDQYFRKPICGKYAVVKLISADNLTCDYRADLRSRSSNIDLKYVSFRGFIGKYAYPTGQLR
jgi:hypothetical protein